MPTVLVDWGETGPQAFQQSGFQIHPPNAQLTLRPSPDKKLCKKLFPTASRKIRKSSLPWEGFRKTTPDELPPLLP